MSHTSTDEVKQFRPERVAGARAAIAAGTMDTPEKLEACAGPVLRDIDLRFGRFNPTLRAADAAHALRLEQDEAGDRMSADRFE